MAQNDWSKPSTLSTKATPHKETPMILSPEKYPFEIKMEMAISEIENRVKSVKGLRWERNDRNTITIYDVPFDSRRLDLICKFRFDGNLYDIYYYEISS